MKTTTKAGMILALVSFALLAAGAFFLSDVFWSWTQDEHDAPLAMICWGASALISLGSLVTRLGWRLAHWIILSIYLLIVLGIAVLLLSWKPDRMF